MPFLAPDIVAEGRGLSVPLCAVGFVVGLLLWLTGWRGHRFWIVLVTTVTAGIAGLAHGPLYRVQPVLAGVLLAVAAGVLALALVRMVAFAAGGFGAWMAVHALAPAAWHEPFVCFLAGGLAGLLLFRLWTMVLTSLAGTVVMGYSGLWLADRLGKLDAITLATQQGNLVNWACGGVCLGGFLFQFFLERRKLNKLREAEEQERQQSERALKRLYEQQRWWQPGRWMRRAG